MLLLLLILNVSRVSIRQLMEFLRPIINTCLWLVLSTFEINLWFEHSFVLVGHPALKGKFLCILYRALSVIEEIRELFVDCQDLVVIQAVWLSIDQALDRGQLLQDKDILVLLVQVDVSQIRIQQVLIELLVDLRRLLQIHDRAQNPEEVLRDLLRLLGHDGALRIAQQKVVPLLPEHDAKPGPLVAHDSLVDEAHVLQDVLDVQTASLVDVVLNDVLVLSVQLHGQVVVRGGSRGGRGHARWGLAAVTWLPLFNSRVLGQTCCPTSGIAPASPACIASGP